MKTLLLFRGAPGCGKSTFINENDLKPYTLSADDIRLLCQSTQLDVNGGSYISQSNDKDVWNMLFKLLTIRMQHGEFTVIDATNSKTSDINRYKELCDQYKYRIFCIDMTDVPIEECKRRNLLRDSYKKVPEEVIDKMYTRFKTQKIPSGVKVLKPNELNNIFIRKVDFSKYDKIIHIGDIHGCYTALKEYFKNSLNDNYLYIFCGDYIDRGIENVEVIKFLLEIYNKSNVILLEGNHERWLWIYANGGVGRSNEFELVTRKQLENSNISLKDIRRLYRKFSQCAWYTYDNKEVLVTHGGLSTMPKNLSFVSTEQIIKGVGNYDDYEIVAESWMNNTSSNMYQIYGHRNTKNLDIHIKDRVYNLEGKVEFGGYLRIVELDHNGFNTVNIKNNVYKPLETIETAEQITNSSVADIVLDMRRNRFIREKTCGNNISSFNFTEDAFYDKVWNEQTILARGLYIDTDKMKIVARGFNKFFNINEKPETKLQMLEYKLKFPVTCYIKENGFLGLISYHNNDLFITTKSDPSGNFAKYFKDMLYSKMSEESINNMKDICKNEDVTLVFECVDMKNDPHIIEYPDSNIYLLDIIKNDIKFSHCDYNNLVNVANKLNISVKSKAFEISSWPEFYDWYIEVTNPNYMYNNRNIEGFVIEDSNGYMLKIKLFYYNFWKHMRSVAHSTLRSGYYSRTGSLDSVLANDFYNFCRTLYVETPKDQRDLIPRDIIYLRNLFYKG